MGLGKKLAIIICLFSLALSAAIGAIGYRTYMTSVLSRYEDFASSILELARSYVDADDMAACLESGEKSAKYGETQSVFNNIKEKTSVTFLYLFIPRGDKLVYYMCAFTPDEPGLYYVNTLLDEDDLSEELAAQLTDMDDIHMVPNRSEYGYMMSAYGPVTGSGGELAGIIGVDIDMEEINSTLRIYIITVAIGAAVFMAALTILVYSYLRRKISVPIHKLSEKSVLFVNQDSGAPLTPIVSDIKTGDEIETLSKSIEKMTTDLITYIDNLTAVTAEKERIGAELSVATHIQTSMLPGIFPPFPDRGEFDIYASMQPAKEVGGDFYDFFLVDENTLAVVIADVSGKGVPAALFMVIAKTLIKNNALSGMGCGEVFRTVNNQLCDGNDVNMFVTAFMGFLDIQSGRFTYSNAGHNPPLFRAGDGRFGLLKAAPGFVLAGIEDVPFGSGAITMRKGDELFLYTDGVTEAADESGEMFGDLRLLEAADSCTDLPLMEFTVSIRREIDRFTGGAEQADDITMLALRYNGSRQA